MTRWSTVKPGVWETAGGRWRISRRADGLWEISRGNDAFLPFDTLHVTLQAAKIAVAAYRADVLQGAKRERDEGQEPRSRHALPGVWKRD